jgi:hypothetical protein
MGALPISSEDFTLVADQNVNPTQARSESLFLEWLASDARRTHDAVVADLTPRPWEVFQRALELGGTFSPSAYADFGANSQMALRPQVVELKRVCAPCSTRRSATQA